MERKILPVIIAILAITGIGLTLVPNKAEADTDMATGFVPREQKEILLPHESESEPTARWRPFYSDYPEIVAFKGIAEKGGEVYSAFFVAIDYEDGKYKHNFLIINGDVIELELQDIELFEDKQTAIVTFGSEKGELKFLVKGYRIDWHETLIATANFDGYLLNLRILEPQETFRVMEKAYQTSEKVRGMEEEKTEAIVKGIIEKIKK